MHGICLFVLVTCFFQDDEDEETEVDQNIEQRESGPITSPPPPPSVPARPPGPPPPRPSGK
jgi:hypothetical protein